MLSLSISHHYRIQDENGLDELYMHMTCNEVTELCHVDSHISVGRHCQPISDRLATAQLL